MGQQYETTGTRVLYKKQQTQQDPGFQDFPFRAAYYLFISFVACRCKGLKIKKICMEKKLHDLN